MQHIGHDLLLSVMAPIAAAFHAEMGVGSFPFGQAARQLAPLTKAGHSPEKIAAHLRTYLALRGDEFGHLKDDPTRIGMTGWVPSLKAFVLTFAKWSPTVDSSSLAASRRSLPAQPGTQLA